MSYRKNEDGELEIVEEVVTTLSLKELEDKKALVEGNLQKVKGNHDEELLIFQAELDEVNFLIQKCEELNILENQIKI